MEKKDFVEEIKKIQELYDVVEAIPEECTNDVKAFLQGFVVGWNSGKERSVKNGE